MYSTLQISEVDQKHQNYRGVGIPKRRFYLMNLKFTVNVQ
jgi:hypothetical protein